MVCSRILRGRAASVSLAQGTRTQGLTSVAVGALCGHEMALVPLTPDARRLVPGIVVSKDANRASKISIPSVGAMMAVENSNA